MANKLIPRNTLSTSSKYDFSKPIDIYNLGGEDDPCFGKLHDLSAIECRRCGDSELCQVATAQRQMIDRVKDDAPYMDKKFDNDHRAYKYIKRRLSLSKTESSIINTASTKYGVSKDEAKQIIKKIKGK